MSFLVSTGDAVLMSTINKSTGGMIGYSVSISGDYAIVSAPYLSTGTTEEGAGTVYICKRNGSAWEIQATLSNPTPSYGDNFGTSVSISGDYAIVGTIFDDTGAGNSGSAYIYKRNGDTWDLQTTLNNPLPAPNDNFGFSVAIEVITSLSVPS